MSKKFTERTRLDLFQVNEEVLKDWDAQDLFHKSMSEREGCPSYVFYEGPPSAKSWHVRLKTCFAATKR